MISFARFYVICYVIFFITSNVSLFCVNAHIVREKVLLSAKRIICCL